MKDFIYLYDNGMEKVFKHLPTGITVTLSRLKELTLREDQLRIELLYQVSKEMRKEGFSECTHTKT